MGIPQNGWFMIHENRMKVDDLEVGPFQETSTLVHHTCGPQHLSRAVAGAESGRLVGEKTSRQSRDRLCRAGEVVKQPGPNTTLLER